MECMYDHKKPVLGDIPRHLSQAFDATLCLRVVCRSQAPSTACRGCPRRDASDVQWCDTEFTPSDACVKIEHTVSLGSIVPLEGSDVVIGKPIGELIARNRMMVVE
jgi:hypothetical protein